MNLHYEYYNPNPTTRFKKDGTPMNWNKGDCVVRTFCKTLNQSWSKTYEELCAVGARLFDMPNGKKTIEAYAKQKGMAKESLPKYMTLYEFARTHNGVYVCNLRNHIVCVRENKIYDVWDCGEYKFKTYYELPKNTK